MRRSASGGPNSLGGRQSSGGPLRVRNEGGTKSSYGGSGIPVSRLSTGSARSSIGGPSPCGSRSSLGSIGSRTSVGARKSISKFAPYAAAGTQIRRLSRGSGVGLRGRNEVPKDPRPVSDKQYQMKSIKFLIEFLSDNGFQYPLTQKILLSPTSKDFLKIFEFINGLLIPGFKCGKKPEEEIPKYMKQTGYPFMISKSSMFAIGSPHTWPHILAALTWLADFIQAGMAMTEKIDMALFPTNDDEFDSTPENKILFEYEEQTYVRFLEGYDTFDEFDEELSRTLKEKYLGMAGGIDGLSSENSRLAQEWDLQEQDVDRLKSLYESKEVLLSDVQRFQGYLNELEVHKRAQEQQLNEVEEERTTISVELDSVFAKNRRMQECFDAQELTPLDVDRIKLNRKELQRQIDDVEARGASIDQNIWSEEMGLSKGYEKYEAECVKYNNLAQTLRMIPVNAENAHGVDYEMRPSYQNYMSMDFIHTIKPALIQMKKHCGESLRKAENDKLKHLDAIEQATEIVSDAQEEITMLESKYKRAEEEVEHKKQVYQREYQQLQEETEMVQKKLTELQLSSTVSVQDAQKQLRETQLWMEQRTKEIQTTEEKHVNFLKSVITEVVEHRDLMQAGLQRVVNEADSSLQKVKHS